MRNSTLALLLCSLCLLICMPQALPAPPLQTQQTTTAQSTGDTEAHAALQRVLARREFGGNKGLNARSWKDRAFIRQLSSMGKSIRKSFQRAVRPIKNFFNRIGKFFNRLARKAPKHSPGFLSTLGSGLRFMLYIILGVAIMLLLGLIISRIVIRRRRAEDTLDDMVADDAVRRKREPSLWEQSLREAEARWQAGDQREALRILYRACLVLLDARGVLRYDETRANGEVLRELRRQGLGTVHQALTPIVRCFDRSWYGYLTVSGDEFSTVMEQSRQLRAAVVEVRHD